MLSGLRGLAGCAPVKMISPAPGSNVGGYGQFTWNVPDPCVDWVKLEIGSAMGFSDLYSQFVGTSNGAGMPLPSDGRILYVRLTSHILGNANATDYTYVAAPAATTPVLPPMPTSAPPVTSTPAPVVTVPASPVVTTTPSPVVTVDTPVISSPPSSVSSDPVPVVPTGGVVPGNVQTSTSGSTSTSSTSTGAVPISAPAGGTSAPTADSGTGSNTMLYLAAAAVALFFVMKD